MIPRWQDEQDRGRNHVILGMAFLVPTCLTLVGAVAAVLRRPYDPPWPLVGAAGFLVPAAILLAVGVRELRTARDIRHASEHGVAATASIVSARATLRSHKKPSRFGSLRSSQPVYEIEVLIMLPGYAPYPALVDSNLPWGQTQPPASGTLVQARVHPEDPAVVVLAMAGP
jgi:hypothetical protein